MALSIPITGIPETYRVPGAYVEILFAQGPSSAKVGVREAVLIMPISDSGQWTAGTLYQVTNEQEAIDGGGEGYPAHLGVQRFLRSNKNTPLWVLPVAETSGGTEVQADVDVTFTTDPTGSGSATVTVAGETNTFAYTDSDTVTTVAAGLVALINSKTSLPVTAAAVAGALTLTAKLAGASQNNAISVRAEVSAGTGITVSPAAAEVGDTVTGVDGTTTEAANTNTALANVEATRLYYMTISATDSTTVGHLVTHITTKSEPNPGLRSVGISASRDTLANVTTQANTQNYERHQIVWQEDSDDVPAQLAANMAAVRSKRENVDAAFNFAGYGETDWLVPAAYDTADWPTGDEQNEAINDGVTPIASNAAGSYIVMSVNTRSKNSAGTVDDFRATETHRVSVGDFIGDAAISLWQGNHQGKKFADDERLADGSVNPNQTQRRGLLRPSQWTKEITSLIRDYSPDGKLTVLLQNQDASIESIRSVKTGSRLESGFDITAIDHANQMTARIAETSEG
jgi:phage tail sheath gpL-like